MKLLRECQNFHTMCAIFGGINMQCIQRLKETWKVTKNTKEKEFDYLIHIHLFFVCFVCLF